MLLEPTRIYVKQVLALMQQIKVKGLAHNIGGGLVENIPRALADAGESVYRIGRIEARTPGRTRTVVV